jgi:uncharacterized protein (TIGR03435 family)
MSSDERRLNELVDRDLPWPTQMEFVAARDRVLDQLRATPQHRLARASRDAAPNRFSTRPFALAVAVAFVIAAVGGAIVWPRGGTRLYAAGNDGLQVTLADDSRVEMRAHAEMTVARASDGIQIELKAGDIIVTPARQRVGHLYVRTKDMTVAVDGTVFLANAGQQGSRVGVIEGEVRVREGDSERLLQPGQQVVSSATIAQRPLAEDITWSRNASEHLAKVDLFMKGMAQSTAPLTPLTRQADATGAQTSSPLSPVVPAAERQRGAGPASPAAQEFEEASIRKCDPDNVPAAVGGRGGGGPNSVYMTPGRLYVLCMTPAALIRTAYGYRSVTQEALGALVNPEAPERQEPIGVGAVFGAPPEDGQRVRGGPDWVLTERYTIEAVAGDLDPNNNTCLPFSRGGRIVSPSPGRGPCRTANATSMSGPMLRALLERRFKLKAHVETEPVPARALVVAPGGLKIKPAAPDSCTPVKLLGGRASQYTIIEGQALLPNFPERPTLSDVRRGQKPVCGQILERNGPNPVLVAGGSTFGALAQALGTRGFVDTVRVYDKTGITDTFDWILEFAPEEDRGASSPSQPTNVPPGPRIFDALQPLGLRLEPAQAPREFIVIDAIERPSPN